MAAPGPAQDSELWAENFRVRWPGAEAGGLRKAYLLLGAQLGDSHRKEFVWISLRSRRAAATPESYSCSSGKSGFQTILLLFLCLFGLVEGLGEEEGCLSGECGPFVCGQFRGSPWASASPVLTSSPASLSPPNPNKKLTWPEEE